MVYSTGSTMWGRFFYRDIAPRRRLLYLNSFANADGGIARAPFSADCPLELLNDLTLEETAGRTTLSLSVVPFGALDNENTFFANLKPSLEQGFGGTYDQLAQYLSKFQSP